MYNAFMNTICLSENANTTLKEFLQKKGCKLIEIKKTDAVYDAVSSHGDIYLCKLGDELVVAREELSLIQDKLQNNLVAYSEGVCELGYQYPLNIKYNAVQLGDYLIHNTKYTDPQILARAEELGLKLLNVKQGYTKCNLVIVDDHSVITSDEGITGVLTEHGIEVLLVGKGYVRLSGFPYGFLGGASGKVDNEIIFNGNLSAHPDYEKIKEFISAKGLQTTYFKEYPLEDIGSIIQV
ncbi:MAG: DUF6873 family GME fold protein [Bacillota bacterium]